MEIVKGHIVLSRSDMQLFRNELEKERNLVCHRISILDNHAVTELYTDVMEDLKYRKSSLEKSICIIREAQSMYE